MAKEKKRRQGEKSKIIQQLKISAVCLIVFCLIIFVILSIRYEPYDYNLTMKLLADVPCIIGAIIISFEYLSNFNEHYTKNDILFLRKSGGRWAATARILFVAVLIVEVLVAFLLGLFCDRNNNMFRFLFDSSHAGLFVIIANILTSLAVMLVQRIPCLR